MSVFRRLFGAGEEDDQDDVEVIVEPVAEGVDMAEEGPAAAERQLSETRRLPPPPEFKSTHRRILVGQATSVGQVRSNNQDACLSIMVNPDLVGSPPPIGFFVVADGMGGHSDGEIASATAVKTLYEHVVAEILLPHVTGQKQNADQKTPTEILTVAMNAANEQTHIEVPDGGTTATCVVIRGSLAYIAHVGDSRAYLISHEGMERVTRDHRFVERLKEIGQLTQEEMENHPRRNELYKAIGGGGGGDLEVDAATHRLPPSSQLLMCSDGLTEMVSEQVIADVVAQHTDPQDACEELVELANQAGGTDNITVVIVRMPD